MNVWMKRFTDHYKGIFVLAIVAGTGFASGFYRIAPSEHCTYHNGEYETLELNKTSLTGARSILGYIPEDSSTGKTKIFVWDNGNGPGCKKIMLEFRDDLLISKKRLPLPENVSQVLREEKGSNPSALPNRNLR